ncbi:MAG TPA: proline dehydrogenase family protein [Cyclobacteriaceae bacterium]|nr:proline dehydrogenase family protein [Cyclobacteriaceae bacterium]
MGAKGTVSEISFDDTGVAFSYKSDWELKKAHFIFSVVNHPWIAAVSKGLVKVALGLGLPITGLIRNTIFQHFCGGESIESAESTIFHLGSYGVSTILDYSVEGEKTEEGFDLTTREVLRTIEKARNREQIPFCVFKVSGVADVNLLEKVQSGKEISDEEIQALERVRQRFDKICSRAYEYDVPVLIDAEETWIQDTIDTIVYEMMERYNRESTIVFNTIQFYRTSANKKLRDAFHSAAMHNYFLGIKLVRGAYMEKERERAERLKYPSPIFPDKEGTDESFNKALAFCLDNKQRISIMCGSHNEYSNYYLTVLMDKHGMIPKDNRVWFAQLYGMSDNISFNLGRAGYNVAKYVPYGPVKSVMPYLFRRADENTSVSGQSSRELSLIKKELTRRKLKK